MSYKAKLEEIEQSMHRAVLTAINGRFGVESQFTNETILDLRKEKSGDMCFNIEGSSNYIVEIDDKQIHDQNGNSYNISVLPLEQLAEIVDYFSRKG